MQPFAIRLMIATILFIIVVSTALVWRVEQIPDSPQILAMEIMALAPPPQTPFDPREYVVPFCELVGSPDRYDRSSFACERSSSMTWIGPI